MSDLFASAKPPCWMRDPKWIHSIPPSAERKSHASSSCFGPTTNAGVVENRTELPSLPDLLDELEADVDLNSLEQLTQSLLQDIARDLEATAQKTDREESTIHECRTEEMVGQTPEELEPGRPASTDNRKSLENDISEYLLLHHNYAAKPPKEDQTNVNTKTKKLKTIRPKSKPATEPTNEVVYGNLDDLTNVVTIIVDNEESMSVVEEPIQDSDLLTVPSPVAECLSPMSCSDSDRGYESLDSPVSLSEDLWDQSISELFPSLL